MSIPISGSEGLAALLKSGVDLFGSQPVLPVDYDGDTYNVIYDNFLRPMQIDINQQASHGFIVGDAVRASTAAEISGGAGKYIKAVAADTMIGDGTGVLFSQAIGLVIQIGSGPEINFYMVQFGGIAAVGNQSGGRYSSALNTGQVYYLSNVTAGAGVTSPPSPTTPGTYNKPLFIPIDGVNVVFCQDRPQSSASSSQLVTFTQSSPSFVVGNAVYFNGTTWQLASSSSLTSAQAVGLITLVTGNMYQVTMFGLATIGNISGGQYSGSFTPNNIYYLSALNPGAGVQYENELAIRRPLFLTLSATQVMVFSVRPSTNSFSLIGTSTPGLALGTALRSTGVSGGVDQYLPADTSSITNASSVGVVSAVKASGVYEITIGGGVVQCYSGLSSGQQYYLGSSGGNYTSTKPVAIGAIVKPLFTSVTPTTAVLSTSFASANPSLGPKFVTGSVLPTVYSGSSLSKTTFSVAAYGADPATSAVILQVSGATNQGPITFNFNSGNGSTTTPVNQIVFGVPGVSNVTISMTEQVTVPVIGGQFQMSITLGTGDTISNPLVKLVGWF